MDAVSLPNISQRVQMDELRIAHPVCILNAPGRQLTAPTLEETPC